MLEEAVSRDALASLVPFEPLRTVSSAWADIAQADIARSGLTRILTEQGIIH